MKFKQIKNLILSLAICAFTFVIVYDTVCLLLKKSVVDMSYSAEEEEGAKTEKEKEKEKEEMDELFFENFFTEISEHVSQLNYTPVIREKFYFYHFSSEIPPRPPQA